MAEQGIEYGRLVERALRRVVHDALDQVAEHGLPGRHHFYITFRTDHPNVVVDPSLRARYPIEMTIVLQHEFWGLEVTDDGFGVTLSFGGAPQRLEIPYAAISVFADPGVEFGLQFESTKAETAAEAPKGRDLATPAQTGDGSEAPSDESEGETPEGGAQVVALDRFRKK